MNPGTPKPTTAVRATTDAKTTDVYAVAAREHHVAEPAVLMRLSAAGVAADSSPRRLAEYAYDASNYRVEPLAVVFPRSRDEVVATVAACQETGTPLIVPLARAALRGPDLHHPDAPPAVPTPLGA